VKSTESVANQYQEILFTLHYTSWS